MIKKKLFNSLKTLTAVSLVALSIVGGINVSKVTEPVTAYAFEHQAYSNSSGYTLRYDNGEWRCYDSNGNLNTEYDGLALNEYGWWKVSNGVVDFSLTGLACNEYGWWYVENGAINFSYNGMAENEYGWWYVSGGCIDFGYSGVVQNEYGWWKVTGGTVDFTYNGLASNENGEWVIRDGQVDFDYNGEYEGKTVEGGCVVGSGNTNVNPSPSEPETPAEKLNGLIYNEEADKWSYYVDGNVDTDNNGLVEYNGGWFKLNNGVVDFTYYGLAENNGYWFKISGGVVDFSYNGLAEYNGGLFKIAGGLLDNEYTGTYYNDGTYYYVDKGTVKSSAPEGTEEAELLAINKFVFDEIFSSPEPNGEIYPTYIYGKGDVVISFKNNKRYTMSIDRELIDTYGFDSFSTFDNIINTIASIN